jgi:hypothetical protein
LDLHGFLSRIDKPDIALEGPAFQEPAEFNLLGRDGPDVLSLHKAD